MLSKVRGDVNPADVLAKPKSLDDMKVLLNFSCLDWCDGVVAKDTCSNNRIEFVNSVGRSVFVDRRTVRPRGGVGSQTVCFGPTPKVPHICRCQCIGRAKHVGGRRHVERGRTWCIAEQTCGTNVHMFGSR